MDYVTEFLSTADAFRNATLMQNSDLCVVHRCGPLSSYKAFADAN